jgi:hypothetical protein
LIELEERRIGPILGHRSGSLKEFLISSHSHPFDCLIQSFTLL